MQTANLTFFRRVGLLLLLGLAVSVLGITAGCAQPKYVHAVFFTCQPGTADSEIDALVADGYELLSKVPSVRKIETGRRDVNAARKVNVTDYDVGLVVHFDDKSGYDAYEVHPTHRQYVEKHKAHWSKVRVFDFVAK